MNLGRITTAPCENLVAEPDPRCADLAFALAHPSICQAGPHLIVKPGVALACSLGSVQFKAFLFDKGQETDVTADSIFTTSDPNVILVGAISGNGTGMSAGTAIITATYGELIGSANVTILGPSCCDETSVGMMVMVDTSRSMSQAFGSGYTTRLHFAKAAATRFISEVNQTKDLVGLMTFNQDDDLVLSSLTSDKTTVEGLVTTINQRQKKTSFYDALVTAIAELDAASVTERVIVLISDGEETGSAYTDATNPILFLSDFKNDGGIVITLGVRSSGAGYVFLEALSTGGFFLNAYSSTAATALDNLSGIKGYICAGNCTPAGNAVEHQGQLNYTGFLNWDVLDGTVDLQGAGFFDFLPGNGLYVDMAGTTPNQKGMLKSKVPFALTAGHNFRITVDLSGNQRVDAQPDSVRLRVFTAGGIEFVNHLISVNDWTQDFQSYSFNFSSENAASVYISIQQEEQPTDGDTRIGLFLGRVRFEDTSDLVILLDDNFDNENPVFVAPACGPWSYGGYYGYGYSCYGEGCLSSPPDVQLADPLPLSDIESGFTPPIEYSSTKTVCVTCAAGMINLSTVPLVPDGDEIGSGLPYVRILSFTTAKASGYYQMTAPVSIDAPRAWTLEGSNDNSTWTALDEQDGITWFAGESKKFLIEIATAFKYFRLTVTDVNGGTDVQLTSITLFDLPPATVCDEGSATSTVNQQAADNAANQIATDNANAMLNCFTLYTSTQQCIRQCAYGLFPVTKSATRKSLVSQSEADDSASAQACEDAENALDCSQSNNTQVVTISSDETTDPASPYPSVKNVTGLVGVIANVQVLLKGLTHQYPSDLDIVLVAPNGTNCLLMSGCGDGFSVSGLNITFDDSGIAMPATVLSSTTYKPTRLGVDAGPVFDAPGPQGNTGSMGATLAVFNGITAAAAEGQWALFVSDRSQLFTGQINLGWDLVITAS